MKRIPSCPLLQLSADHNFVCFGGVNFFSVGEDRELCQHCRLPTTPNLGAVLSCSHIEVYTALSYEDQKPVVSPIFECDLRAHGTAEQRCTTCPAFARLGEERTPSV